VNTGRCILLALTAACSSGAVAGAQTSLTGRTIRLFAIGDYVLPRFSPSGQLLAISEVLADTVHENTQILILDMRRGVVDTLLPAEAAAKYATYKAYVSDFEWLSDSSLLAWIPDGDVGAAVVTFNVRSKRIMHEEHHEGEEDSVPPYQLLADSLGKLYPDVAPSGASPSDVFGSALGWPTVRVRSAVLLQKRYAGVDDDVWLYRLDRPEAKRILPLSGGPRASLAGGFATARDLIFAAGSDTLGLYRWRSGRLETLMQISVRPQASSLSVRRQRGDSVWFILMLHQSYEHGNNPAFLYDGERLVPLVEYANLADFDVHPATRRIAFVYWDGAQRHLAVKELVTK
jgi:hypothetical protein